MITRVINLEPTGDRWNGFVSSAQSASIEFERFAAVDTRTITSASPESNQVSFGPGTLKAMIGCTLSHLALWQECAASGETYLIFEDDARFIAGVWDTAEIDSIAPETDILILQAIRAGVSPNPERISPVQSSTWFTTCAYRLTPAGAAALLAYCRRVWSPAAGETPTHFWEGIESFYFVPYIVDAFLHRVAITGVVNVRLLLPNPIAHSGLESIIVESDYLVPPPPSAPTRPLPFPIKKANTLRSLDNITVSQLSDGIAINGITLAAATSDQEAFSRLLTLLREAHELQPDETAKSEFLSTPQVITDLNGTPHTLSDVPALRQLLVGYGVAIRDLWTAHATRRAAAAAAINEAELEAALNAD